MFRAMWLQFNSITGCQHCVWIIRKSSACSNCVSFTQRWPHLRLPPPGTTRSGTSLLNMAAGAIGIIVLASAQMPHHRCINCYGCETERWIGVVFMRMVEEKEGGLEQRKRERERRSVTVTNISSGSKLDWDLLPICQSFQPECGREAGNIQSFSNMTITLER